MYESYKIGPGPSIGSGGLSRLGVALLPVCQPEARTGSQPLTHTDRPPASMTPQEVSSVMASIRYTARLAQARDPLTGTLVQR
jgi:hypothetical protein